MRRMLASSFLLLSVGMSWAGPPEAPLAPDDHTLLLAHFDRQFHADHSKGPGLAEGRGRLVREGRFAGGLALNTGESLTFSGEGNFPNDLGTIEFWIKPGWAGDDPTSRSVVGISAGDMNYLNINKLPDGRFGAGMSGTAKKDKDNKEGFIYRRADHKIDWKAGEWHHVAISWGNGELVLWLDGKEAARCTGALPPQDVAQSVKLVGSDYVLDELCISDIVRYTEKGRIAGNPVPAHANLTSGWKFNGPDGVYTCAPPKGAEAEAGMVILPRNYLDETDPKALPRAEGATRIELFAAPGEIEPAAFLVVAAQPLKQVSVQVSDLKSDKAALPADRITVRRVVRTPMRRLYTSPSTETEIVNRFLPRWETLDVPAGELREVWLSLDLPAELPPGTYTGTVTIAHAEGRRAVPVQLEVPPIRLIEHPKKQLASYYRMDSRILDRDRLLRELRDMRAHGVRHLFSGLHIEYRPEGDKIVPDFQLVREGLDAMRVAGFRNATVIVGTGFPTLASLLGHKDIRMPQTGESLDGDAVFQQTAKEAMQKFLDLGGQYPDFRLVATHLDEVFGGRGLLDLYIRYSKAVRQVPQVKLYITFHTVSEAADEMRRRLIPFVDLRCNHGYSFELWLTRGHTMDEYQAELRQTGQEAWFYHNARGVHFTPEWARIINGVYLWASPFTAHCPWTYQSYVGNPFDDTDGRAAKGHDFGMSFPGIEDPADLVPTRLWEAMREGGDDLRYIATLEKAIADSRQRKPEAAAAAEKFLADLKGPIHNAHMAPAKSAEPSAPPSKPAGNRVDIDTGLVMGEGVIGSASESPLINALAHRFTGDQWQGIRRQMAEWIVRLQ